MQSEVCTHSLRSLLDEADAAYLEIVKHPESRHAGGRGSKKRLQDGRGAGLVLLFGGHRWRTRAWALAKGEKGFLQQKMPQEGENCVQTNKQSPLELAFPKFTIQHSDYGAKAQIMAKAVERRVWEDTFRYLVAPDAGFFGNKVVECILHFGVSWN